MDEHRRTDAMVRVDSAFCDGGIGRSTVVDRCTDAEFGASNRNGESPGMGRNLMNAPATVVLRFALAAQTGVLCLPIDGSGAVAERRACSDGF
jgi:hypothetical protein